MKNAIKQAIITAAESVMADRPEDRLYHSAKCSPHSACVCGMDGHFMAERRHMVAVEIADTAAEAIMEIVRTFDDIEARTPTLEIPPAMLADLLCPQCAELEAAGSDGLCRPCSEAL